MRTASIIITVLLLIGGVIAAAWIGSTSTPPKESATSVKPPTPPKSDAELGPKISASGPYPKAVVPESEFDFGTLAYGTKGHKHTFLIRNEGAAPLELLARDDDRTCQCTGGALASDAPVPPGGEVAVEVTWKIELENPSFRHSVKVRTNDPEHKVIELVIRGNVEKTFLIDPPGALWDLGLVSGDRVESSSKAFYSRVAEDFQILELSCKHPRLQFHTETLTAEELKKYDAKSGVRVNLTADLQKWSGRIEETLDVKTNVETQSQIPLQIRANRPGPINVMARNWDPDRNKLFLGEFAAKEGKQAEVMVVTRVEEEVKLLSAKSKYDAVKVEWVKDPNFKSASGKAQRYVLKLKVLPGNPVTRRLDDAEKIDLQFDHPEIGALEILVDYLSI